MMYQHPWATYPGFYIDDLGQQRILIDEIEILMPSPEQEAKGEIVASIKHVGVKEPGISIFTPEDFGKFVDLFKAQDGWKKVAHYSDGQPCPFNDCGYTGPFGDRVCPGCGRVGAIGETDVRCYY